MLKFRDPQSNIQLAEAELTYKEAVNGEKSLTGTIYSNDDVLHQMERGWSVMFNGDWYYITYVAPTDGGNSITVEFDAVHEFFFKMSKSVAYGTLKDGSHSAKEYLDFVFNGSEYSYTLLTQVDAWEKQNFGDKNRLALFNDLISDMEMEFSIADSGRIMITPEIGQDLSTIVRKGFNLQELNLEYNVVDFVTYAKGFGAFIDKDNESKGRYEAEYTSPLASVYGKLEADPITDERYTKTASLQAALKKAVDSSYSISVGISLEELQNAGYDYESPVPGDYILAVDEQLDFNQRIRIISVEEQYNIYGERISSSVEAGSLSATKQKLDGSESNSVVLALSHATEQADNAVKTANGKNTSYSGPNQPQNPREGDMWWYDNGSGTSFMKQYTNGEWVMLVDSNTKQNIEKAVDSAIETSKTYTDELNENQVQTTNALNEKVDKSVKELTDSQQNLASQATAYTDSAVADANAKAVQIGQTTAQNAQSALNEAKKAIAGDIATQASQATAYTDSAVADANTKAVEIAQTTAQNAQKALDEAKQDFTSSFASQASQTASMASDVTSKASQYASQAKSEAIAVATSADGVVRTEFKSTTDSMTATIQQNKSDADGKITKAQTTATQALDGLSTKVEKTEYNQRTGELSSKINETSDTAEQSKQDIIDIKETDSKQDNRMLEIEKDAKGIKQTVSDLSTEQGKQSGYISTLKQRADGFDGTVAKIQTSVNNLGQINQLFNTEFYPDFAGWYAGQSVQLVGERFNTSPLISASTGWNLAGGKYNGSNVLRKTVGLGSGLHSDLIPVQSGSQISMSMAYYNSSDYDGTVPMAFYVRFYDADKKYISVSPINGSASTSFRTDTYTVTVPEKATYVSLNLLYNGATGTIYYSQPMLVFSKTVGSYVQGNYNNNDAVAKAQLTADQATLSINNYKTDADGRISKAQADIKVNADAIATKVAKTDYDKKTGDLTTSVNKAQQTADTATQTIGTYKETNDKRVASAETNIKANSDAIKSTVSKTDFDKTTGKINGDISSLTQRADGFDATVTKVNNLAVGGRNYLLNSSGGSLSGWKDNTSIWSITSDNTRGNVFTGKPSVTWTGGGTNAILQIPDTKITGKQVTVSFWAKSSVNGANFHSEPQGGATNFNPMLTTTWARYSYTISSFSGTIYFMAVDAGTTYYLDDIKLELGNVATDWTPAPEDVDNATAKAQLTADNATLAINNYKTDADGRISKVQADIVTNAKAITQKVSQSDYNTKTGELTNSVSKAQQTADSATLSINNYKTDADGRISKAQADIKVNADAIATKVAKTDYDKKTGDLTTSINKAQQTADSATQTIGTYKETNDKRVASAETNIKANDDAIKLTVSKTDFDKATGKINGDISSLTQRADGFDATVAKVNNLAVGGRNYLLNSSGSTLNGWRNNTSPWSIANDASRGAVFTNTPATTWTGGSPNSISQTPSTDTVNQQVTVSFWAKASVNGAKFHSEPSGGANALNNTLTTSWSKYSYVIQSFSGTIYFMAVDAGTTYYLDDIKLELGNVATDWTPAPEDVDTQLAQVKITADGVYQTVNDPQTGLNTRVSTAEGNITKVQDSVGSMSNTVTETADGLTREIADRKTGDSNTLQAGKDFTTSQITSYDTGMQSRLTQFSDGIMAQVSATNLITDSSFVNATSNWTLAGDVSWKIDNEIMRKGVRVATFDNGSTNFDRKTSTLTSTPIYTTNLGGTQFYASIDIYAQSFGSSAYMKAEIVQKNSSGTTTKTTAIGSSFDTAMTGWNTYTSDITLDPATTQLYLQVTQYGGGKVSIARPYLGSTKLNAGDYIPGASNDNTSTLKLFNNFFAFGIQSNTGALIAGINGDSSGLNIVGEKITITGDTNFIGKNFMDGALIKNASIGTAQIADVSITNAKIASLDVNKISGNVSNFIQSNWNGKYGSTTIDANGMKVDTNGVNTQFGSSGMVLNMTGESIGGIGVQGFAGKPSYYQGLTFWLDGNAEYMAWGARNDGVTSGNPITKLGWFRSGSNPIGTYAGFNFDDNVYFGGNINVQGASNGKLIFGTQNFNNINYPYFGDSRLTAGLAYGSAETYLISGTNYYYLSRVIKALSGLGAVKIPSAINSDGTVAKWFNVTL